MTTMETLSEESYEHSGPVALCKGGGGGAAGKVDFPTYMKTAHNDWLDQTGTDTIESSMVDAMNAALGNSPFTGAVAYDPDDDITALLAYVSAYDLFVGTLGTSTTDTIVAAEIAAFDAGLSDQLEAEAYPAFEAGMLSINAVMSSAFVMGRAIIEDGRARETAKYSAEVRARVLQLLSEAQKNLAQFGVESYRIKSVLKSEETTQNLKIDESDAKWDMEVFQHGSNLLASISGAAHPIPKSENNTARSAVGGALSGAAAGAMMGSVVPGIGTGVGAAIGGLMGIGQAFL